MTCCQHLLKKSVTLNSLKRRRHDGDSASYQDFRYFVRLFERDGKSGYLKDLPRVMWYLLEESKAYAELEPFMQFMRDRVMPAFEAKYGSYEVAA